MRPQATGGNANHDPSSPVILLPIIVLRHLKFRRSTLWGWLFVLLIGSMSIVAALVRYAALRAIWGEPKANVSHTIDVWAMVEITTSLLAVCSPALRVFFRKTKEKKAYEGSGVHKRVIITSPDLLSTVKSVAGGSDASRECSTVVVGPGEGFGSMHQLTHVESANESQGAQGRK